MTQKRQKRLSRNAIYAKIIMDVNEECSHDLRKLRSTYSTLGGMMQKIFKLLLRRGRSKPLVIAERLERKISKVETQLKYLEQIYNILSRDRDEYYVNDQLRPMWENIVDVTKRKAETLRYPDKIDLSTLIDELIY